jgi:hypothetical protein
MYFVFEGSDDEKFVTVWKDDVPLANAKLRYSGEATDNAVLDAVDAINALIIYLERNDDT